MVRNQTFQIRPLRFLSPEARKPAGTRPEPGTSAEQGGRRPWVIKQTRRRFMAMSAFPGSCCAGRRMPPWPKSEREPRAHMDQILFSDSGVGIACAADRGLHELACGPRTRSLWLGLSSPCAVGCEVSETYRSMSRQALSSAVPSAAPSVMCIPTCASHTVKD